MAGWSRSGVVVLDERGIELLPGWRIECYVAWCMAVLLSVAEAKRGGVVGGVESFMG